MGKRGRKPGVHRKGYFYEEEEEAFMQFLTSKNKEEREKIFREKLYIPFTKMIESIIRGCRYVGGSRDLHVAGESFEETFVDCYSNLVDKMSLFKPEKGSKAYSYTQTICKNYLIYRRNKHKKNEEFFVSYDANTCDLYEELYDSEKYSYNIDNYTTLQTDLIDKFLDEIYKILDNEEEKSKLSVNELKVIQALEMLFSNWEELWCEIGSDKWNKNAILLFIKETTLLEAKQIREAMVKFKSLYNIIKEDILEN